MLRAPGRIATLAVLLPLAGALVGGALGGRVRAEARRPPDQFFEFNEVLALIEQEYVGELKTRDAVENAIEGLLGSLDPHSNYLNTEAFADMRDEQRGRFYGLGIQITKRGPDKPLTIIAPIDGTPASRAGLQSGDVIAEIEGQPTIDMTVQDAVRQLKGDRGTKVTITIQRPRRAEPLRVTLERDEIPIQSVRVAYLLPPDVGVVRVASFSNTTADELDEAVRELRAQGMQRLILDLRGNPGGLLDQAVEVAQRFLAPGSLIVYTEGRIAGSDQRFVARRTRASIDLPLVVLVDRSSASASEIVSGAIQDHDRGVIVGETTFGKGLVQRLIELDAVDGAAIAVTTAKYYTPAGRLIQRDYSDLDEYYLAGMDAETADGQPWPAPRSAEVEGQPPREVFHTTSGRVVYGGGGITPDHVVQAPRPSELWLNLLRENLAFDFSVAYVAAHPDLAKDFRFDDAMAAEFLEFLAARDFELTAEEFAKEREDLGSRLRAQVARIKWDAAEEARIRAESDPQIQRALTLFEEAERLRAKARAAEGQTQPRSGATGG